MMALLLVLAALLPPVLALGTIPLRSRSVVAALLPLAPVPALLAALAGDVGTYVVLPDVLLGLALGMDAGRRLLLGVTALLWIAAAIYSRGYIARDANAVRYDAFFLLTMGGNLGLIVALDVPGFYVFFSLMTLSSYILVVFERTERAYRAGRAYIALSILGETCLLFGFMRAAALADSVLIADIPAALAVADGEEATLLLLFVGFAIKAGQLPLHVWLPLAHPAAPTPASAVLSGAMIKAGLLGMLLFFPVGLAALPWLGTLLTGVGLATAFYGVFCGLSQDNPKTVLAYSSLSQMGVMVGAVGVVLSAPGAAPAVVPAVLFYAAHHGLAKAALFFSVGVVQRTRGGGLAWALALAALCAVAIAGAPVTAGAVAKLLLKQGVGTAAIGMASALADLLQWSALATGLLMLRFLAVLRCAAQADGDRPGAGMTLWGPFAAVAAASQALPWTLVPHDTLQAFSPDRLWEAFWPLMLSLLLAAVLIVMRRVRPVELPRVPEGDWIALLPTWRDTAATSTRLYRRFGQWTPARPQASGALMAHLSDRFGRIETALRRQQGTAAALLLLAAAICAAALWP